VWVVAKSAAARLPASRLPRESSTGQPTVEVGSALIADVG
jgi:hypothetical protein